jgi:CheY-like chemotaxis protein
VATDVREGWALLRVRDDGVGMEPSQVERMFEPFAQADQGIARSKGGLGLGLALVKGLVELHGGAVSAHSEGVGRGAEFTVTLPCCAEPRPDREPVVVRHGPPREVLVVEDNPDAAETLADILSLLGHHVRIATDGRSGLALARDLQPDVVLCDIGLPDMDGYEIARTIRADETLRGTRLVALTGYAQPEDRQRALDAGFDAHAAKPLEPDALARLVAG